MTLVVELTTVANCQEATDPPLEHWIYHYCEQIYQKRVSTMIYVKESVTHVTTHPCCKYTVYQQFPQLNSYDYSVF